MLKALFFCGILTVSMSVDLKSEGQLWISQLKKADAAERILTGSSWKKVAEVIFLPCSPIIITIFYLWSGSCRFLLKDTVYQMESGDLVFIAPGELHHSLYSAGEVCEIVMIYFKEEYLHLSDWSADSLTSISGQGLQLHSFMGSVPTVYQEYLRSLLTRMLTENSRFDQYSEHFERCYLEELLLMLMRHSVMNEKEPDLLNSRDADILLATKYIYNNFRKPLTLEEVSSVASLSPTYFSKKFKLITGMGFKEYLNYVRLKHAQTALLTSDSSITDIALEYGFNDSNYFKDLFKKVYGKSPREYRKNPD